MTALVADPRPIEKSPANAGTIKVGKRTYAVGLFWAVSVDISPAEAARQNASGTDNLFCVRDGDIRQYALGSTTTGHRSGMPSAAALAADVHDGSWCGVFKVADGYWYINIVRGNIQPNGDRFFIDATSARDHLQADLASGTWSRAYAPAEFGIQGTNDRSIDQLLIRRPVVKLAPLDRRIRVLKIAAPVVITIAGAWAVSSYYNSAKQDDWATTKLVVKQTKQIVSEPPPPPQPPPWRRAVNAKTWLNTCFSALGKVIVNIPGWDVVDAQCAKNEASARYHRSSSTIPSLIEAFRSLDQSVTGGITDQGQGALLATRMLYPSQSATAAEPVDDLPSALQRIWSTFQETGETASANPITVKGDAPPPSHVPGAPPQQAPTWPGVKFEAQSAWDPQIWAAPLAAPGLVIGEVTWSAKDWRWGYSGILFLRSPK